MNQILLSHIFLASAWIIFSLLHSLLATHSIKRKMQIFLNSNYKFYKSIYSLFSSVNLTLILIYNFSIQSILLWQVYVFEKIFAVIVMIISAYIILIFTKRFFFDLSGADAFQKKQSSRLFINTSLYKYVRHPLYSATIVFAWSIFLWKPLLSNLVTCICITVYTLIGIILEEKKLISEFGEKYIAYQLKTPMLIPKFLNKPID